MTAKVKICGLKTETALDAALAAGADFVGFVFYGPSPRNVAPESAARLAARARGRARIVTLFVDPDDAALAEAVPLVEPDIIQLHGAETPERTAAIRSRWRCQVMKAIPVEKAADAARARAYKASADRILFDAKAPRDAAGTLPGGNGLLFDWRLIAGVKDEVAFMLSGGLTPANVGDAIRATGASHVDVSSGVEVRPGEKDPGLIRRFVAAAKRA